MTAAGRPLDLDEIQVRANHLAGYRHRWAREVGVDDPEVVACLRAAKEVVMDDVPALLAEIERLRALLPEGGKVHDEFGRRRLRTDGEWTPTFDQDTTADDHEAGIRRWVEQGFTVQTMRRQVWTWPDSDSIVYGPWEPVDTYPAGTDNHPTGGDASCSAMI